MAVLNRIAFAIGIAGASVIVWGVFLSILKLLSLEAKRIKKKNICEERDLLRHHLHSSNLYWIRTQLLMLKIMALQLPECRVMLTKFLDS